jgi:amidase
VPNGIDQATGMPTSIQIVAAHWADALTFRAGQVIEDAIGALPSRDSMLESASVQV